MAIREGKWICSYCGAKNRGRDLACTTCSATRDKDVAFFLEDEAPEVVDEAELAIANAGFDWICNACGTSNRNTRDVCKQCGSPREDAANVPLNAPPVIDEFARSYNGLDAAGNEIPVPPRPEASADSGSFFGRKLLIGAAVIVPLLVIGALVLAVLGYFAFREHDVDLVVESVHWTRSVEVEELQTLTQEAWENEVPSDARVLSKRREVHHTQQVQTGTRREQTGTRQVQTGTKRVKTGTKNMGNGYYQDVYEDQPVYRSEPVYGDVPVYRDDPVYMNRVRFMVDRWVGARTDKLEGNDLVPTWPNVPTGAKVRPGKREAKYTVSLRDPAKGKTYEEETEEGDFGKFAPGSTCRASINGLGSITKVVPPGG